jgi:hypothetical protein
MLKFLDSVAQPLGFRVVPSRQLEMFYLHDYSGGYDQYRQTQIKYNKRKIDNVWANATTLGTIADDLRAESLGATGICHGARNGFEVDWFRNALGGEIIGTDIS